MEKLSDVWVLALFKKFQARYLLKWTSAIQGIEGAAMKEWGQILAGLDGDDIKRGLDKMNSEWTPTAYEFRELCKKPINPHDGTTKRLPKPQRSEQEKSEGINFLQEMMECVK